MSNKNDDNSPLEYSENPKSDSLIIVETEIKSVKKDNKSRSPSGSESAPAPRRKK